MFNYKMTPLKVRIFFHFMYVSSWAGRLFDPSVVENYDRPQATQEFLV
jgi:hypothetical protein